MKRAGMLAMAALVLGMAACDSGDDGTGVIGCDAITGLFTATTFTATGSTNATLTNNFLANGGSFKLNFSSGVYTSTYVSSTGVAPMTRTGIASISSNSITLAGSDALFTGGATGNKVFSCSRQGNTITLTANNTTYVFPGQAGAQPARINITMTGGAGAS